MPKHLVLVGGGHAHLTVLSLIHDYTARGHRVTLVSPTPFHYYSGMGPGLLGGLYRPEECRFPVRAMAEAGGGTFVEDAVARVDPHRRILILASGGELPYDVASFNTGSRVPLERLGGEGPGIVPVKPVERLLEAREAILARLQAGQQLRLLVAGGGPAGVEVAGNLARLLIESGGCGEIVLVAGERLLGGGPQEARELALESLQGREVAVLEGVRVRRLREGAALLDDGSRLGYDVAFAAVGIEPSPLFRASGLPTGPDGGLLVDACLQCVVHPELFGGGDCIHFGPRPLDKVGVYAVRQNPVLHHNLLAALEERETRPFTPQQHYLLIFNLGDGHAILRRQEWVSDGRLAFRLKDRIDRRFVRRFQPAVGRPPEPHA
jgi:NADH dehydrogenase FAD-containing subunit